ncbi:Uncharacterised protein, partial [Metamycoplasma alkalescens]
MPSKIKKGLIATGIVAAVIAVPAALTLIPYSIQKSAFNKIIAKNNELIEQYKKSEQEFLVKYNEKRKRISETKNEIAALEDEYNEKINQENPNQEEIKGLQEQIAKSKEKIQKLENEYQEGIFKFVLPSLEKLAREGNSKHTEDIIKYTALYIVNKHKQFNTKLEDLGKSVDLYYPKEEEATRISRFYQGW